MCVCVNTGMYVCTCVHPCMCTCMCTNVNMYAYVFTYMHTYMYVCICYIGSFDRPLPPPPKCEARFMWQPPPHDFTGCLLGADPPHREVASGWSTAPVAASPSRCSSTACARSAASPSRSPLVCAEDGTPRAARHFVFHFHFHFIYLMVFWCADHSNVYFFCKHRIGIKHVDD